MGESGGTDYPELSPHGWESSFPVFRETPAPYVESRLSAFLPDASTEQLAAWRESIPPLQREVGEVLEADAHARGYGTILEYQLPLNHRRPDILLLTGGSVLVVEAKGKARASQADLDQVSAYARDLAAYHELCEFIPVHPILMLTRASGRIGRQAGVHIIGPDALDGLVEDLGGSAGLTPLDTRAFLGYDRYRPLPSLIRAARELFETGDLRRIKKAAGATKPALEVLTSVAHEAARAKRRFLVLVTGSPGTGKTLVGLQFVHSKFLDDLAVDRRNGRSTSPAVFLSGNGPLVEVLQYELRGAGGGGKVFVRDVKSYVERYLDHPALVPDEHVVVFDEAQRAWDAAKVAREHRGSTPGSEPGHLISFADRIPDWCVVVGLIGPGQEIHDGEEAGLSQWRAAIDGADSPSDWTVIAPPGVDDVFAGFGQFRTEPALRLVEELRYHSASIVHGFVDGVLTRAAPEGLRADAELLEAASYHLRITRDLDTAKGYFRDRYADNPDARYGLIASSRDKELPRFGVANDWNATLRVRKGPWFCDGDQEPFGRSGRQLRDCVTEFGCQGLELDGALIAWGTDFIRTDGEWSDRFARRYQRPNDIHDALGLRRNAYRVLLTRGRDGSVIYVPPIPVLDETFRHLLEAGFRELPAHFAVGLGADSKGPDVEEADSLDD
ncbi:MAG: DNA/RNA helicase domain-containing protein [Solirubrobacterales bacterium]